jgi:hypothetical protein
VSAPPQFAVRLLGWRPKGTPNTSDSHSSFSKKIAENILEQLDIPRARKIVVSESTQDDETGEKKETAGVSFEKAVEAYLADELAARWPERAWSVRRQGLVSDFTQYAHLAQLQEIIKADKTRTLGVEIGRDYLIKPDVTVSLPDPSGSQFLHASVSCKWTIRSDRVQNIRHEAVILTRHRRGRQPHIVAVTAEPLPTRLAAIARGTGEVDAVYHVVLSQLVQALDDLVNASTRQRKRAERQKEALEELIDQHRLLAFTDLVDQLGV